MNKVEIFDPAMCCSTGVCGPSVDPNLTRVSSAVYSLEKRNNDVQRYQLTTNPDKFVSNTKVSKLLEEKGPDALPVVLLNGEVVKVGEYPTNEEFAEWFDVTTEDLHEKPKVRISLETVKKNSGLA